MKNDANVNNPAYDMDPTYFTRGFSKQAANVPTFASTDLPPLSVFHEAQTLVARRATAFVPRHIEPCLLAEVYFSDANLKWIQQRILNRVNEVVGQQVSMGSPDATNLKIIMQEKWDYTYMSGELSDARTVHQNLALLDKYVVEESVRVILLGVEQQLDYVVKSTRGAQYDDPFLTTISVGDKLSTQGGTLNTSSVILGTGPTSSLSTTPSTPKSYHYVNKDWDSVAAEDAAFQSTTGFRSNLDTLPSM